MRIVKNPMFLCVLFVAALFYMHVTTKQKYEEYLLENIDIYENHIDSLQNLLSSKCLINSNEILDKYKNIDTLVMNHEWGREEIYIFENKK
jgi:hypothetical protein